MSDRDDIPQTNTITCWLTITPRGRGGEDTFGWRTRRADACGTGDDVSNITTRVNDREGFSAGAQGLEETAGQTLTTVASGTLSVVRRGIRGREMG